MDTSHLMIFFYIVEKFRMLKSSKQIFQFGLNKPTTIVIRKN